MWLNERCDQDIDCWLYTFDIFVLSVHCLKNFIWRSIEHCEYMRRTTFFIYENSDALLIHLLLTVHCSLFTVHCSPCSRNICLVHIFVSTSFECDTVSLIHTNWYYCVLCKYILLQEWKTYSFIPILLLWSNNNKSFESLDDIEKFFSFTFFNTTHKKRSPSIRKSKPNK